MLHVPLSCLVFDCDGTLLDSVAIKTRAFARVAEPFGAEARDLLLMFHQQHGGVSRVEKFHWLYETVYGRPARQEEIQLLCRQFAAYVDAELRQCPLIPGALETLECWHRLLPLHVCSGAPQEEVTHILQARGLAQYFTSIQGSPPKKAVLLQRIVDKELLLPEEALMVGDSSTDFHAATTVGTQFYGCGPEVRSSSLAWGPDLRGLTTWIAAQVHTY